MLSLNACRPRQGQSAGHIACRPSMLMSQWPVASGGCLRLGIVTSGCFWACPFGLLEIARPEEDCSLRRSHRPASCIGHHASATFLAFASKLCRVSNAESESTNAGYRVSVLSSRTMMCVCGAFPTPKAGSGSAQRVKRPCVGGRKRAGGNRGIGQWCDASCMHRRLSTDSSLRGRCNAAFPQRDVHACMHAWQ